MPATPPTRHRHALARQFRAPDRATACFCFACVGYFKLSAGVLQGTFGAYFCEFPSVSQRKAVVNMDQLPDDVLRRVPPASVPSSAPSPLPHHLRTSSAATAATPVAASAPFSTPVASYGAGSGAGAGAAPFGAVTGASGGPYFHAAGGVAALAAGSAPGAALRVPVTGQCPWCRDLQWGGVMQRVARNGTIVWCRGVIVCLCVSVCVCVCLCVSVCLCVCLFGFAVEVCLKADSLARPGDVQLRVKSLLEAKMPEYKDGEWVNGVGGVFVHVCVGTL